MIALKLLKMLENAGYIAVSSPALRDTILSNNPGDALDSVVAAAITAKTVNDPVCIDARSGDPYSVEGCIYV